MSRASAMLDRFADALCQPGGPPPSGLMASGGAELEARFNVYRNNVFSSLIEALRSSYPIVAQLVGEAFFTAMAREFIIAHPPTSPVLLEFGGEFPGFLEAFEPVDELAFLPDTARLESAWLKAYHAADARVLTGADFADILPEQIADLRLKIHPAFHALSSPWPVGQIWAAHQNDAAPEQIDLSARSCALCITRPGFEVLITPLKTGIGVFSDALAANSLGQATELALAADPAFDLTAALTCLISNGAFTRLHNPANP